MSTILRLVSWCSTQHHKTLLEGRSTMSMRSAAAASEALAVSASIAATKLDSFYTSAFCRFRH